MELRRFLRASLLAAGSAWVLRKWPPTANGLAAPLSTTSQVALTAGSDHVDIIYQGLQRFKTQIAAAIGNRPILVKPNNVIGTPNNNHGDVILSDTCVESLEAILEFLQSIGKTEVVIAEACATDPTMVAFDNCGYFKLSKKYPVRFLDLHQEGYEIVSIYGGRSRQNIRISKMLVNPDYFVISAPKFKTHNNVVATLSLKNIAMGSPIVDPGLYRNIANCRNDKSSMHGNGNQDLNDNIHLLASRLAPDLAVIDGFEGMQGDGPCWGTKVAQHVAVVSLDFLAADRVGIELMGIDSTYPAYLNYCHQTGLGQFDLNAIEVLGEPIATYRQTYQLSPSIDSQLGMRAAPRA